MSTHILDAAFNLVNDYPGGAGSLAPRIVTVDKTTGASTAKSASTLAHEVRGAGTAKFGLVDAVKVTDLADNNGILLAWCHHRHLGTYPLPDGFDASTATGVHVTEVLQKLTALITSVTQAYADGRVTSAELTDANRKFGELTVSGLEMLRTMQRNHEAGVSEASAALSFPVAGQL